LTELGEQPRYFVAPSNDHSAMVLAFGASKDNMTDTVIDSVVNTRARSNIVR
jgi:hypothetical protein